MGEKAHKPILQSDVEPLKLVEIACSAIRPGSATGHVDLSAHRTSPRSSANQIARQYLQPSVNQLVPRVGRLKRCLPPPNPSL